MQRIEDAQHLKELEKYMRAKYKMTSAEYKAWYTTLMFIRKKNMEAKMSGAASASTLTAPSTALEQLFSPSSAKTSEEA